MRIELRGDVGTNGKTDSSGQMTRGQSDALEQIDCGKDKGLIYCKIQREIYVTGSLLMEPEASMRYSNR